MGPGRCKGAVDQIAASARSILRRRRHRGTSGGTGDGFADPPCPGDRQHRGGNGKRLRHGRPARGASIPVSQPNTFDPPRPVYGNCRSQRCRQNHPAQCLPRQTPPGSGHGADWQKSAGELHRSGAHATRGQGLASRRGGRRQRKSAVRRRNDGSEGVSAAVFV